MSKVAWDNADGDFNNLTIQWYARANVTSGAGSGIDGAEVNITDADGTNRLLENTSSGLTSWTVITDKVMNHSDNITYNNHSIITTKVNYHTNTSSRNINATTTYHMQLSSTPIMEILTITPSTAYTNDTIQCTFNVTDQDSTLLNVTVYWQRDGTNIQFENLTDYTNNSVYTSNLTNNDTFHNNNITCNVSAADDSTTINNVTGVVISNFSTTVAVVNSTGVIAGERANFSTNYSKTGGYAIAGVGSEIGRIMWTKSYDADVVSVGTFDCNQTNRLGCVVSGLDWEEIDELRAYWGNGSAKFNGTGSNHNKFATGDLNGDGYQNGFAVANSHESAWYNTTGLIYKIPSTTMDAAYGLTLSDLNNDAVDEIIFGTIDEEIFVFYVNGSQKWNRTGYANSVREFVSFDINGDGIKDIIAQSYTDNITALNGTDGSVIWESLDNETLSLEGIDLDSDGQKDEFVAGTNAAELVFYNSSGADIYIDLSSGIEPVYELAVADLNNDSIENEVAFFANGNLVIKSCNLTECVTNMTVASACDAYNIILRDIDDDNILEIILGGSTDRVCAFETDGTQLFNYLTGDDIGEFGNSDSAAIGLITVKRTDTNNICVI